jgi:endo-beta-N-acetylglucosaminidase D
LKKINITRLEKYLINKTCSGIQNYPALQLNQLEEYNVVYLRKGNSASAKCNLASFVWAWNLNT